MTDSALERARRDIIDGHYCYCQKCIDDEECEDGIKHRQAIDRLVAAVREEGRIEGQKMAHEFAFPYQQKALAAARKVRSSHGQ